MNNSRRIRLRSITERIEELKDELEVLATEEEDAFDNLPESIQDGQRGQDMEENFNDIQGVADELDAQMDTLLEIIER